VTRPVNGRPGFAAERPAYEVKRAQVVRGHAGRRHDASYILGDGHGQGYGTRHLDA
jgi:hypothetical protein